MDLKQASLEVVKENVNVKGLVLGMSQKVFLAYLEELALQSENKLDDMALALIKNQMSGPAFEQWLDGKLGVLA